MIKNNYTVLEILILVEKVLLIPLLVWMWFNIFIDEKVKDLQENYYTSVSKHLAENEKELDIQIRNYYNQKDKDSILDKKKLKDIEESELSSYLDDKLLKLKSNRGIQ